MKKMRYKREEDSSSSLMDRTRAHKVSHKVIMKGLSQFRSLKIPLKEFISSGPFGLQN